ncbi:FecR family protein [Hyalangium rubrum]|uniref:FecR family protein n=1 Tax=Hyalangium rubrum TaxID=3103134 RepID=A0ABU5HDK2_9BACT|nr:FecR family protein [Hyalangium sp. s54d21]MDY7231548.1 FecR family protein [Hyalangium sp. s54d21]
MKGLLRSTVGGRAAVLAALVLPGLALASVGKVLVMEGTATRTDASGQQHVLLAGAEIEVKDSLQLGPKSNLKIQLNDNSVLMLAENSQLYIDEATFEGVNRKSFSARLGLGSLWAHVKKVISGSEAKFEVKTERAVAGVRGTIFRVDYVSKVQGMTPGPKPDVVVRVVEGRVVVEAQVLKTVKNQTQPAPGAKGDKKQARTERPPPREVTQEQWEAGFANLQKEQQVRVGSTNLGEVEPLDWKAMEDDFGRFVNRNK